MEQIDQFIRNRPEFLLLALQPSKQMREFASGHLRNGRGLKGWNLMGGVHSGLSCANALFDV
jgi:hypothetical protein